jgi:hypothetical protein
MYTAQENKPQQILLYCNPIQAWKTHALAWDNANPQDFWGIGSCLEKNGLFVAMTENHPIYLRCINDGWRIV